MRNILLTEGKINISEIENFIQRYGINGQISDPESQFHGKTLLFGAITDSEIDKATQIKLVEFLLSHGANVNFQDVKKLGALCEVLILALQAKNLDVASLLLKKANLLGLYQGKNLIEHIIELKDPNIVNWMLDNARNYFFRLDILQFNNYYHQLLNIFCRDNTNPELKKSLEALGDNYKQQALPKLQSKFSALGKITATDIPLILAAQMDKKAYPNTVFNILNQDIPQLTSHIVKLLENTTSEQSIKFQLIYFPNSHAIFGEFQIDKTSNPPIVRYLHCDSLPGVILFDQIITADFIKQIAPLAVIEVYDSNLELLKGTGCSYLSIDGAMLLATPDDRPYKTDIIEHFQTHGKLVVVSRNGSNIHYTKSDSLPARYIRGMQFIEDQKDKKGLSTLVFFSEDNNIVVNKKNETAGASIAKHLEKRSKLNSEDSVIFNNRAKNKMIEYGKAVTVYLEKNDCLSSEFPSLIEQFGVTGLGVFCDKKIEADVQIKPKV